MNQLSFWNHPPLQFDTLLHLAVLGAAVAGMFVAVAFRKFDLGIAPWWTYLWTGVGIAWLLINPHHVSYVQLQHIVNGEALLVLIICAATIVTFLGGAAGNRGTQDRSGD
jgi:hypothetical protein